MISKISGKINSIETNQVEIDVAGLTYVVMIPSGLADVFKTRPATDKVELHTIYYIESSSVGNQYPRLVGFVESRENFSKY